MSPKRIATRPLIKYIGLGLLFFAVLEICARMDDFFTWQAPLWQNYSQAQLTISDEKGIRGRPHGQYEKWQLNSFGFRSAPITLNKEKAGITRIVTSGASETFGLYESAGNEFPAVIQTQLNQVQPHQFEVINAAWTGMTLPHIVQTFRNFVKQFNPDILIYYPSPQFYLNETPPTLNWSNHQNRPKPTPPPEFRILQKVKIVVKKLLPQTWQSWLRKKLIARVVSKHPPDWVWQQVPPERITLFRRQLLDLIKEMKASNIKLILTTHSTRFSGDFDQDREQVVALRRFFPRASELVTHQISQVLNQEIVKIANAHQIPLVDINQLVPKTPQYLADFSHFTDAGALIVGSALAQAIQQLGTVHK